MEGNSSSVGLCPDGDSGSSGDELARAEQSERVKNSKSHPNLFKRRVLSKKEKFGEGDLSDFFAEAIL